MFICVFIYIYVYIYTAHANPAPAEEFAGAAEDMVVYGLYIGWATGCPRTSSQARTKRNFTSLVY